MTSPLKSVSSINASEIDGIIFVNDVFDNLEGELKVFTEVLRARNEIDKSVSSTVSLVALPNVPAKRLIYSPCGLLNGDYVDARNIYDAAINGGRKAISAGLKRPLFVVGPCKSAPKDVLDYKEENLQMTLLLGAFYSNYICIETREFKSVTNEFDAIYCLNVNDRLINIVTGIEEGRRVARDIGGSDQERMAAIRIAEYLQDVFKSDSNINLSAEPVDPVQYPLMAAVDRGAKEVPRHAGRLVKLEYKSEAKGDDEMQTIFLIGKGITFDTGGVDVKINSSMTGMHRDKCGAAAVCGFMKTLAVLKPVGLHVKAYCAFVRNSVGEAAYTTDEIIISRANVRVRVGNTDAEGRMAMADILCLAKEEAMKMPVLSHPMLFTVATLTGHVIRAYGDKYTAVMCNGLARQMGIDKLLQESGGRYAEPMEISRIRREDMSFFRLNDGYADVLQCNTAASSNTPRGHMIPAGFLQIASGLDKHGLDSEHPLAYTHLDCAGSSGLFPSVMIPTGAPMMGLVAAFVLDRIPK